MTTPELIIIALFSLLYPAILLVLGAYLYHRGRLGASPLPSTIERVVNPPAKPPAPPAPTPPKTICPSCRGAANWKLTENLDLWVCQHQDCGSTIPGPKARILS